MRRIQKRAYCFGLALVLASGCRQPGDQAATGSGSRSDSNEAVDALVQAQTAAILAGHPTPIAAIETQVAGDGADPAWLVDESDRPIVPEGAYFVAPDGDDAGPGTQAEPWRSVLRAFSRLSPGDTLVIRGGTYTSEGTSDLCGNGISPFGLIGRHGTPDSWITIMGYPGERPVLYSAEGWQTLYLCDCSFVKISHLEVRGEADTGNTAPANGVYVVGSHHVVVEDVWSHDNGGCGICSSDSNHLSIQGNRVWGNARWNPYHASGISLYMASNAGGVEDRDGYSNRITGNLVWMNFEDDSLGIGQQWGVTDGNGIIVDNNNESGARGRTLIMDNILADNGGPGVMITRSHAVDVVRNTLYRNVRTRVPTVVNNGDIGCNGGYDAKILSNIIVPRKDNPNLYQSYSCRDISHADNVWVKTNAQRYGPGDIVVSTGTGVLRAPALEVPEGDWTPIGLAVGHGARGMIQRP